MEHLPAAAQNSASMQPDPTGIVDTDRGCVECAYNLRGLPAAGVCPECGTPVAMSLRGILLQYAGKDYLETVRSGLSFVLNGILLMIIVNVVMFGFGVVARGGGTPSGTLIVLSSVAQLGVSVLILFGYWRYTQPDPGFIGNDYPDTPRKVVRAAVAVQAVTSVLQVGVSLAEIAIPMPAGGPMEVLLGLVALVVGLCALVAWLVGFFGIMRYTAWIASRVPDQYIIKRCRLYMWLLPVIAVVGIVVLFLGPLIALVMYWNLLDRMRKHFKSILATGSPAALPGV